MPEFIYEKSDNKSTKLTDDLADQLAKNLSSSFEKFDDDRVFQINNGQVLLDVLDRDAVAEYNFNDKADTDSLYELKESLRSSLMRNAESAIDNFAVFGRDEQSQNNAATQRLNIINSLNDMDFKSELKEVIDDFLIYGDLITFTNWHKKVKQVRRQKTQEEDIEGVKQSTTSIVIEDKLIYEGAKINFVPAKNFVFDVYCDDFDNALKIQRKYVTYDDIKAVQNFKLSEDAKEHFNEQNTNKNSQSNSGTSTNSNIDSKEKENKIELLECWGDIKLDDGTLLRNWLVVVADSKYIIRFEPNPYINNPYSHSNVLKDSRNRRGVTPLRVAIFHSGMAAFILSKMLNILALVENPPMIGAEGMFGETGEIGWQPGKFFGIDDWTGEKQPQPVQFSSLPLDFKFLDYLKSIQQSTTGIYPYMSGIQDTSTRTATESGIIIQGQQMRLSMMDNTFKDFFLANVEKVAELNANYKFENEMLPQIGQDGVFEALEITPEIMQGDYKYDYTDRRTLFEKQNEAERFLVGLERFVQMNPDLVNLEESLKYYVENQDIKNSERFLNVDTLQEQINRIPAEQRSQYKPILAGMAKQLIDAAESAIEGGQPIGQTPTV